MSANPKAIHDAPETDLLSAQSLRAADMRAPDVSLPQRTSILRGLRALTVLSLIVRHPMNIRGVGQVSPRVAFHLRRKRLGKWWSYSPAQGAQQWHCSRFLRARTNAGRQGVATANLVVQSLRVWHPVRPQRAIRVEHDRFRS